jgi:hypothetical protein
LQGDCLGDLARMRKPLEIVHEDKLETSLLCKMGVDRGVSDVNISAAWMDLAHAM